MTLFSSETPARPMRRGTVWGIASITVAIVAVLVMSLLPTVYVIQQPGPVYDTLGVAPTIDGGEDPLITVPKEDEHATTGSLFLTTVQVRGNREKTASWLEIALAWFDRSRAIVPVDSVFPPGETQKEREEVNAALMLDSQKEAKAAAFNEIGEDLESWLNVVGLEPDSPAEGILRENDQILSANGRAASDVTALREEVAEAKGSPIALEIRRDGEKKTVEVTPVEREIDGVKTALIGVRLTPDYHFPIEVDIQLDRVGGPSAGMMFALGIIDKLTDDDLTGGKSIAGTGTINAQGEVGPIGGIVHKLYGARDEGAKYFLAPEKNCGEVVGNVPDGLRVFSTASLADSLNVLKTIRQGGDLDVLASCHR